MNRTNKIPVTIVTGFLGAGKTTFINKLLQKYPETQFALVENEFGDVSIDSKLIKGVDASQLFELKQGCICCTIADEYELVLQELIYRFPEVEHLLIETTGIADPSPVIQPFFKNDELKRYYEYKTTICLLDATQFHNHPEKEIFRKQLVVADRVLVNKSESKREPEKEEQRSTIEAINPFASIQFISFGDASEIDINADIYREKGGFSFVRSGTSHRDIGSQTLHFENPLPKVEFVRWLAYTLDVYKNKIYRCKGVLYFQNEPFEYILQGVGGNYEITEGNFITGNTSSTLVFIGNLEGVDLYYSL